MKIKEIIKEHKKEVIIIGGTTLLIGSIIAIKHKPVGIGKAIASFIPNVENDTVDLIIQTAKGKNYVFAFDYGELPGLAVELEDSIACIRPQG